MLIAMSYDDFDVIVYRVLRYIYSCMKEGVQPSLEKAQELSKCNDVYWSHVVRSMVDSGYVQGVKFHEYLDQPPVPFARNTLGISQKGAQYLQENSKMHEVAQFLGSAFEKLLEVAIKSTMSL